jgi:putative ABC transport system permease protein
MSSRVSRGGMPAREAVLRWSLRMFRREWRQQVLISLLVAAAVATTILGAGIISGSQVPQNAGYGTANQLATLSGQDPHLAQELSVLRSHFGPVGVIDAVPVATGTVSGALLESLDPHGPYVAPLVQLASGRYPAGPGEVDLTSELAELYGTHVGGTWVAAGTTWHVVGEVRTPTDLNATFALAAPGAIAHPATVTALFDATPDQLASFSPPKAIYNTLISSISTLPVSTFDIGEVLLLVAATFGMLFIGLIAVAGFTVLARRRTRAIGMLGALGADESLVRLALLVNGLVVGVASMALGGVVGFAGWWLYAPHQQASVGHVVDPAAIPWWLVVVALVLAPVTTTLAALRPARATSKLPVVAALSGRPTEPTASRRNAARGVAILAGGVLLVFAGSSAGHGGGGGKGGGVLSVLLGIVLASVGLFMVSQWIVAQLGRLASRAPVAAKVALRDLARYRSRSGAALGAICLALLVTGVVVIAATARYSDPFDWVGPNLASNVVMVYPPGDGFGGGKSIVTQCTPTSGCKQVVVGPSTMSPAQFTTFSKKVATEIGASDALPLYTANGSFQRTTSGPQFNGQVFVATPELLAHYGISPSSIDPNALVLTARAQLPAAAGSMALVYGQAWSNPGFFNGPVGPCPPGYCVLSPSVQYVAQLPVGTSAPNTVLTMHALQVLHLTKTLQLQQYLLTTPHNLTTLQKQTARTLATATGTSVETANSFASLDEVLAWAIGAGLLLALGVLAMTVGLIRSETAAELRVLAAAGASRRTRRTLTAVTAGSLGFVGAALGIVTAYLLVAAFLSNDSADNFSELTQNVPLRPLGMMLLGLPLLAALGGMCFAGREPTGIAHQPIE